MHNKIMSIGLFAILSLSIISMLFNQYAYAFSLTDATGSGGQAGRPTLDGTRVVIPNGSNVINFNKGSGDNYAFGATGASSSNTYAVNIDGTLLILGGTTTIQKIGFVSDQYVLVSSTGVSVACTINNQFASSNGILYCGRASTSDSYIGLNPSNMTVIFTSTNLNTQDGCDNPNDIISHTSLSYVVIPCSGASIVNTYSTGTNTLLHSESIIVGSTHRSSIAYNLNPQVIAIGSTTTNNGVRFFNYTTAGGFSTIQTITGFTVSSIHYDDVRRIFYIVDTNQNIRIHDAVNGNFLTSIAIPNGGTTIATGAFWSQANDRLYIVLTTNTGLTVFNPAGVPLGTGGSNPEAPSSGGIDCTIPANEFILICRITDQTGGNIGGLGGILDTGIYNIFTNSGLIDGTDTNPQTNGVGYFITASAFMLMIGVFFVASKNNLDRIPNYIYMIVSIAILGGLTAIGWIDPTLLVIGIVIISGLAVAKYRDVLSGGFGGSGDFR